MRDNQTWEELKIRRSAWEKTLRAEVERWGERRKEFYSSSGIPSKNLYTPVDLEEEGFDYLRDLGFPGEYPFTRGISANMYRSRPFLFRIYTGFGTPREMNQLKLLEEKGAPEIMLFGGGVIPLSYAKELKRLGVREWFRAGTNTSAIIDFVRQEIGKKKREKSQL